MDDAGNTVAVGKPTFGELSFCGPLPVSGAVMREGWRGKLQVAVCWALNP